MKEKRLMIGRTALDLFGRGNAGDPFFHIKARNVACEHICNACFSSWLR